MKWIKASERLPEHDGVYYIKWISSRNSGTMTKLAIEHYKSNLEWLDESPSTEVKGQQGVEAQAEWEFLTIIRANRAILKNADSKVAFPNHSAKSAALEIYDDMIEIISHLPAKRSGKEKQVADYVNNLSQPPEVGQEELWDELVEKISDSLGEELLSQTDIEKCKTIFTLIKK